MKTIIVDERLAELVARETGAVGGARHSVLTAATASEILDLHRRERADLIVTSLDPAGMTGEELCGVLRSDGELRRVSIVVVGGGGPGEKERLRSCRANHYFVSPVDHEEFTATVHQLLGVAARQKYGVLVSVDVEGRVKGVPFFAKTQNLSVSGVLITATRPLKVCDLVDLAFFLPGYGRILVEAEVVRTQVGEGGEVGYGARLVNVSPPMRTAIAAFVGSRFGGHRPEGPKD